MKRIARFGLPALIAALTLGVQGSPSRPAAYAAKPPAARQEARRKLFAWFDSLGYDAVRTGKFVCMPWYRSMQRMEFGETLYGFVVSEDGRRVTILTTGLGTLICTPSQVEDGAVYEPADFSRWVAAQRPPNRRDEGEWYGEGPLTKRARLFVISRACDARGLDSESAEFLRRAMSAHDGDAREDPDFKARLSDDLATYAVWDAISQFGDPSVTRPEVLARMERIARDFPKGPRVGVATKTIATLRKMVAEDEAHKAPSVPLERLPADAQVAELVFQLRDQPGFQGSVPGYPDLFDVPKTSPANLLVKLGFAAVPQLLDILRDDRYTRAMQAFGRVLYTEPLRYSDASREILSKIAHRSFEPEDGWKTGEERDAKTERLAREWWKEARKKGEERVMIEGVQLGDDGSPRQAEALAAKYPSSAVAAIGVGLSHAESGAAGEGLVDALLPLRSSGATALAGEHMISGKALEERLAGARVLSTSDPGAATQAMISEWRRLRGGGEAGENLVSFLARSGRSDAAKALSAGLASRDPETRVVVVQAFIDKMRFKTPWGYPEEGLRPTSETENSAYQTSAENLLAGELTDTVEAARAFLTYGRESFGRPRICDLAASEMAILWPARYGYRVTSSLAAREVMRIKSLNTWRGLHGLSPLPCPSAPACATPTDRDRALVAQAISGSALDERRAVETLLPRAASALPLVLKEIETRKASKLDCADLNRLATELACKVSELTVEGRGGDLNRLVAELDGRPLTAAWVRHFVNRIQSTWPAGLHRVKFTAERDEDGRGFKLAVTFITAAVKEYPSGWSCTESVDAGGCARGISGGSQTSGVAIDEYNLGELVSEIHQALSLPPLTAVSIHFYLARRK